MLLVHLPHNFVSLLFQTNSHLHFLQLANDVVSIFSKMRVSTELYRDGLCAQDSVTDVSNPFSRYRTQWGKSPRAMAGMGGDWTCTRYLGRKLLTPQQVWPA